MEDPLLKLQQACRAYQRASQCGFVSTILFTVYLLGQLTVVFTGYMYKGLSKDTLTALEVACLVPAGTGIMFLTAAIRLDTKTAKPYVIACLYRLLASIAIPLVLLCVWS